MRPFSWRAFRMWQRNLDVFLRLWHTEVPGFVIEPLILLLAMGTGIGTFVGSLKGQSYLDFIAPGIIASYGMFSAAFECTYGTYFRMEPQRTFDAIIATPMDVEDVIAGEIFWGATRAAMTGTIILIVATAFQLIHSWWALLIPAVSFLGGIMFSSVSMLFTSYVPSFYSFNY
jgi:lipooligosaccharide transport system permease protein